MAQTTDAVSSVDADVAINVNGGGETKIEGFSTSVETSGGDRMIGELYTHEGDTAVITSGKREPIEVTVKYVYTEGASDPFEAVRAAYEGRQTVVVSWWPKGDVSTNFQFDSDASYVKSFKYPDIEAESGDPLLGEFTITTAKITKSVVS